MMQLIVYAMLVAAAACGLLWLNQTMPPLTLVWDTYRITLSAGGLILGLLALGLVFFLFYALLWWLYTLGRRWRHFRQNLRLQRQNTALTQGIIALSRQNAKLLHKSAERLSKIDALHPAALLLQAHAAELQHKPQHARQAYTAMLDNPELETVGLRGLLNQAKEDRNLDAALGYARRVLRASPHDGATATLLLHLLLRKGDWREAQNTLRLMADRKLLSEAAFTDMLQKILLERSRHEDTSHDTNAALDHARRAHQLGKGFAPALLHYAGLLARSNTNAALRLLRRAWSTTATPELARLYITLTQTQAAESPQKWQKSIQLLTKNNPDNAGSLLLRAHAAMRLQDIPLALALFQRLASAHPERDFYFQLAALEERLNNTAAAEASRQKARHARPLVPWICSSCQHPHPNWQLVCRQCHSIDTLREPESQRLILTSPL